MSIIIINIFDLNINGMAVFLHCSEELGVIRRLHVIFDDLVLAASPDLEQKSGRLATRIEFTDPD